MNTVPTTTGVATVSVDEHQLIKSLRWYDGFVICLANPGFLISALGGAIGSLGTLGAVVLWTISMVFAVLNNQIYTEPAMMFPDQPGGVPIYSNMAWRRYFTFFGPMAAFGYWSGWTAVLAIFGLTVGQIIQGQWFPTATWGTTATGAHKYLGFIHFNLGVLIGIVLIVAVWIINAIGVKPAVWVGYVTGALLMIPLFVFIFFPYFTGTWHAANLSWFPASTGTWNSIRLAAVWMYLMGWSSYGVEAAATFAPEYHDSQRDTRLALRRAAMFSLAVFCLLPLGTGGVMKAAEIGKLSLNVSVVQFLIVELHKMIGNGFTDIVLVLLIASFVLSMNTATMDGSRALYGISKNGLTIKWLNHINKHHVPSRGMTVDMVTNVLLLLVFGSALDIYAASNLGYIFTHCLCLSGVIIMRRTMKDWPRPLKLKTGWLYVAGFLAVANFAFIVIGAPSFGLTGYGGYAELLAGIGLEIVAVLLYIYRRVVQDHERVHLQDKTVLVPDMELFRDYFPEGVSPTTGR
ncbi:MAG: APC family permease [Acidimicrobiales bacterium]